MVKGDTLSSFEAIKMEPNPYGVNDEVLKLTIESSGRLSSA